MRQTWRTLAIGAALVTVAFGPGCAMRRWFDRNPYSTFAPCGLQPDATAGDIVSHLNANATRLTGFRATGMKIAQRGPGGLPISISAMLAVEAPRNLRLLASGPAGGAEVDLGSNADRFWFWAKRNDPPQLVTARHDELAEAQRQFPIPFEPEWLLEALGVLPIDADGMTYETLPSDGRATRMARLVADRVSPRGEPLRKIVVVDTCHGLVLEHALVDARNQMIARAVLSGHYRTMLPGDSRSAPTGPVLPARIDLDWPRARMSLTMYLGTVEVNPTIPTQTFELPQYAGTSVIDLGAPRAAQGVRRADLIE